MLSFLWAANIRTSHQLGGYSSNILHYTGKAIPFITTWLSVILPLKKIAQKHQSKGDPAGPERPDEALGVHAMNMGDRYPPSAQMMSWLSGSKGLLNLPVSNAGGVIRSPQTQRNPSVPW